MSYVIRASSTISNCLYSRVYSRVEYTERALKAEETDADGIELTAQLSAVHPLPVPSVNVSSLKEI